MRRTRLPTSALLAIACLTSACAARRTPANDVSSCPCNVVATVSNPFPVNLDVYYRAPDGAEVVLGEVQRGGTVTFSLPGIGNGRVLTRRPPGDNAPVNTGVGPTREVRGRIHCASS